MRVRERARWSDHGNVYVKEWLVPFLTAVFLLIFHFSRTDVVVYKSTLLHGVCGWTEGGSVEKMKKNMVHG